ncbi:ATP-binding protein [Paenibacillus woosongensis]|uniref:histidine kinase n=1 Tax=Paenibacillus woosongensis TaxID=307580 RepID=A0A7X2Z6G0_9BACL|nr:HAMP domain-containing sensor histidine kinase [Paenibacillus woosongensis]MUG47726.1 HAMP domain-containing protein [Paenibacillus woosongensis]
MRFHLKIFLTMASAIVGISIIFVLLTHLIVSRSIEAVIQEARGSEVSLIASELENYYLRHNQSWEEIEQSDLRLSVHQKSSSVLVMDNHHQVILQQGDSPMKLVTRLGVKHTILVQGKSAGYFYYYDPEIASFNKILIGIPISVVIVISVSGLLLLLVALIIAYQLSKWLASPLKKLLPSIERLGQGELGIQADVKVQDEYGQIASAFNLMSAELQKAEKLRRNMSADIAHELRTPLTIIGGKMDELQQRGQPVPPEMLLPLQDELIRLNRLVEELRTLSLAEAGQLHINKVETDMADLAQQLCAVLEPLADEKNIAIHLEVLTQQTNLLVDPNRIRQVLLNLLTNAIRYTPNQGTIWIRVLNTDDQWLNIIVEDTGIGIAAEHLPHLFDRFYRTDDARSRARGGSGLGLAIAKQYVRSHQGTIKVESQENQGTRFTIQLPYANA